MYTGHLSIATSPKGSIVYKSTCVYRPPLYNSHFVFLSPKDDHSRQAPDVCYYDNSQLVIIIAIINIENYNRIIAIISRHMKSVHTRIVMYSTCMLRMLCCVSCQEPSGWEDILIKRKMTGVCHQGNCNGRAAVSTRVHTH